MDVVKKISVRIFILAALLVAMNYIYSKTLYKQELLEFSPLMEQLWKVQQDSCEMIYLGESSNTTYDKYDLNKKAISTLAFEHYPQINSGKLGKGALHAGNYLTLLKNIPNDSPVKTLVVTMNLRSFNAQWVYSGLETALQKEMIMLKQGPALYKRFLLSFKGYDIKTTKEREEQFKKKWQKDKLIFPYDFEYENCMVWDQGMAQKGYLDQNGNRNQPLTELACHYIKAYAFQINPNDNPRIDDFDKIVELAQKRKWNLVFNLLAENHEKAELLVGKDLLYLMEWNRNFLIERYHNKGALVVDNFYIVQNPEFIDQNWTTEHYSEKGRKAIAANLADSLKKIYPAQYREVAYPEDSISILDRTQRVISYFNDCENNKWPQQQTLTNKEAFSGEFSSAISQNNPYSITFEKQLNEIPFMEKRELQISFSYYSKKIIPDAKIAIDIHGEHIENYWAGYSFITEKYIPKNWETYTYEIVLPFNAKRNGEAIKVYCLNSTPDTIYIDDFKLEFILPAAINK